MAKILITHSYFLRFDPKQWTTGKPYAPLGTLYSAAVLRQDGHEVVFDNMFSKSALQVEKALHQQQPGVFILCDDGFNYLTKMCLTNMREAAFEMIKLAKSAGCTVIVSSSDSTDHFEKYLEKGADFIVIGEAEQTIANVVRSVSMNKVDLFQIDGLAFMQGDSVVKTQKAQVQRALDSIPFPAWDLIDMKPYREMWQKSSGYFSINMATTRGCPFKCNWCAKPIYGNRYNSRSADNVVAEIKFLKQKFDFDHIWFCDDIFGLKPGWVREFATALQKENIKIRFKIQARADLLADKLEVHALSDAGCETVWMGAESGSQKILDAMDKGISIQQIETATTLLRKHGIQPCFFIQFGYPGESKADIKLTVNMINRLLPHELGISVSYPLPGTVFFENVKSQLEKKSNWNDSNELALMFRNTYQPAYYKQLHRYVHHNYRREMAVDVARKVFRQPMQISFAKVKKMASYFYYLPASIVNRVKLTALEKS